MAGLGRGMLHGLCVGWVGVACVCAGLRAQVAGGLLLPAGVAYDSAGNLYFADTLKNQVFEVSLAGVTSIVAGTGTQGFAGDGGAAAVALLNGPSGVAVGADGTLYIADTGNERVRAVAGGVIKTMAGNGVRGFSDGGGDARMAMLHTPVALAFDATTDAGSLLIADSGNHRVRRLSAGKLTAVAGTGVQGFSGDGGLAVAAQLDTPMGVAVAEDGRVFLADSHNHRLRVVRVDGVIATFAGSGMRGFGGDGGAATKAALYLPRGVGLTAAGEVLFADSDNHRLRKVDAAGVITTVAGDGVQGMAAEGASAVGATLDSPRGVAVSGSGAAVFSDSRNRMVQAVAGAQALYGLSPNAARAATVTVTGGGPFVYGQGSVMVAVQSSAPVPVGGVTLLDNGAVVANGTLAGAGATLPVDSLSAGAHTLSASFAGDGLHGAAVSAATAITVTPLTVTVAANRVTMVYGGTAPVLNGTVNGVLTRDVGKVKATFVSSAPDLAPVGLYPITATLAGSASGNYQLAAGGSTVGAALQVVQAAAGVTVGTPTVAYAGLPMMLTASLVSATRGTPTGVVSFLDNGTVVATASAVNGFASAVYLSPAAGVHTFSATYGGDRNFLASTSPMASVSVGVMPDFTIAVSGSAAQTVQGGGIATYTLQVAPQFAPFTGVVSFSASGLQSGAAVSFSPVNVVPGSNTVAVTMSVQTKAVAMMWPRLPSAPPVQLAMLLLLPVAWRGRKRAGRLAAVGLLGLVGVCGCGARTVATSQAGQTFAMTVTATSTNLGGAVVTHSVPVNLTID